MQLSGYPLDGRNSGGMGGLRIAKATKTHFCRRFTQNSFLIGPRRMIDTESVALLYRIAPAIAWPPSAFRYKGASWRNVRFLNKLFSKHLGLDAYMASEDCPDRRVGHVAARFGYIKAGYVLDAFRESLAYLEDGSTPST